MRIKIPDSPLFSDEICLVFLLSLLVIGLIALVPILGIAIMCVVFLVLALLELHGGGPT